MTDLATIEFAKALAVETDEYKEFVEKFKPKKTTDDCYTPQHVYTAILEWVTKEYKIEGRKILRPFYPGGNFETLDYPADCVVVDNPPFSILSKIIDFYIERGIAFFLFAPALTLFSSIGTRSASAVIANATITYENGANVKTAFITNLSEYKIHVSSELFKIIDDAQKREKEKKGKALPKYEYPNNLITSALIQKIADKGQDLRIKPEDCHFVRKLDAQKNKAIFGGGFLLSANAAAEKAAAEKANVQTWTLSARELEIIGGL